MICKQKDTVRVIPPFNDVEDLINSASRLHQAIQKFEGIRDDYNRDLAKLRKRYQPAFEESLDQIRSCLR